MISVKLHVLFTRNTSHKILYVISVKLHVLFTRNTAHKILMCDS
jgi:hypothetical protein